MKNINTKQRLLEIMSKVDKTFKLKLNENDDYNPETYTSDTNISSKRADDKLNNTVNSEELLYYEHMFLGLNIEEKAFIVNIPPLGAIKVLREKIISAWDSLSPVEKINKYKNALNNPEFQKILKSNDLNEEVKESEDFFPITTPIGSVDDKLLVGIVNKGIDSHLEGFTKSKFSVENGRRKFDFAISELPILLRRLEEVGTDEALQLKDNIENYKDDDLDEETNKDDDLLEFTIPDWALATLINGDNSGNSDEDDQKIDAFVNDTVAEYGNANFMLGDENDDLGFCHSNDIDNLGSDCHRLYLKPSK